MGTATGRVRVAGLDLAYREAGSGRPVVLLHGAYEDGRAWRRQLEGLADEFRLVAWDAPGCGDSDDPPDDFTERDYADCLAGLISALRLGRPCVLGLSWGSMLALGLYQHRPDLVGSLVLASAYAGWAGSLPAVEVARRKAQVLRELDLPADEFIPDWMPTLFTENVRPEVRAEAAELMRCFHPAGMRVAFLTMADLDYTPMLASIAVPTLLLYGERDVRSPVSPVAEELHRRIPGSELVVIPGAPHVTNMETPEAFNGTVRTWLRGVAS